MRKIWMFAAVLALTACSTLDKTATRQLDAAVTMVNEDNAALIAAVEKLDPDGSKTAVNGKDGLTPATREAMKVNSTSAARLARSMARAAGNEDLPAEVR